MFLRNLAHFKFYESVARPAAKDTEMMAMLAPDKNPSQPPASGREHLAAIIAEFSDFIGKSADLNAVNLYLLAKVQKELGQPGEARQNFGRSLMKMPLFRQAWLELVMLLTAQEQHILEFQLKAAPFSQNFFCASLLNDLSQMKAPSTASLNPCPPTMPIQNKFAQQSIKEFDLTPNFFRLLFKVDPFHIDKVKRPQFPSDTPPASVLFTREHHGDLDSLVEKIFAQSNEPSTLSGLSVPSQLINLSNFHDSNAKSTLVWLRKTLTKRVIFSEADALVQVHFSSYCKKQPHSETANETTFEKKFSPLSWYVEPNAGLEEDQLYAIVKKVFLEVDLAISLDLAAGGPAIHVTKNVPNAGRGTQYIMLLGDEKRKSLSYD